MTSGCTQADCTVTETGTCLLNNDPSTCPERIEQQEADAKSSSHQEKSQFPSSRALMLSDARELMAERYLHVIGILGEPEAGKTACLVSMYLLVANRQLNGFRFVDSRTLMGFEDVSRGARHWDETHIPEHFTERTERADDRFAGFLHIRLMREKQTDQVELLCSDLPGEWTSELIEKNRADRLGFLKRADAIWIVLDGTQLARPDRRQVCLQRTNLLIERLAALLERGRRIVFVITRRDLHEPNTEILNELCEQGRRYGFESEVIEIASFADDDGLVSAGYGITSLIERSTSFDAVVGPLWRNNKESPPMFDVPKIGLVGSHNDGS